MSAPSWGGDSKGDAQAGIRDCEDGANKHYKYFDKRISQPTRVASRKGSSPVWLWEYRSQVVQLSPEGSGKVSEPMTGGPACGHDAHTQSDPGAGMGHLPSGGLRPLPGMPDTLASCNLKVEICDAPPPILAPLLKKRFPSPSHAAASLDRGRGSGQKGKCEKFPSACHQSPQAFGVVALRPSVAMEPLETPVKDGILYQQHVKFGKVGTWLPRIIGPRHLDPGEW